MSPLLAYRQLLQLAGPSYVVVAFLGRLPQAMSQLGTLLLVADSTGSYAAGGAVAGTLAVSGAAASPIGGALADRLGQRPVVLAQSLLAALALLVLVALSIAGMPWQAQAVAAAAAGVAMPLVGPLARVRWSPLTARGRRAGLLDAAFSYEGTADEASFVVGPALVGAVTAVVNPVAAIVAAAVLLAVFGSLFALHETADLVGRSTVDRATAGRLPLAVLAVLGAAQLLIGVVFGSVQTGTTALATAAGSAGHAGLLHALLGVGSVVAGIALTLAPRGFSHPARLVVFAAALLVLAAPLVAVESLGGLALALTVLGFAVAPYMITVFTMAGQHTPAARLATMMTILAGVTSLGYAIGSSVAGRLADEGGHHAAFWVPVTAAGAAFALAAAGARTLRAPAGGGGDDVAAPAAEAARLGAVG